MGDPEATSDESEEFRKYRSYLSILACRAVPRKMQARVSPSDLVQQTIAEAWQARDQYRGEDDGDRMGWLRGILTRVAAENIRRHMGTDARDVAREVDIAGAIDRSGASLDMFAASSVGPASAVARNEQTLALTCALDSLGEDDRNVLLWRHFDDLPHAVIAERLGKTESAARMHWVRALKKLREAMQTTTRET